MDLDPFHAVGITAGTMRFLDIFLLHCLLRESPPDTPQEIAAIVRNQQRVAARGARAWIASVARAGRSDARRMEQRNPDRVRADRIGARRGERRQRASRCPCRRRGGARQSGRDAVGPRARGDGARPRQLPRPVRSRAVPRAPSHDPRFAVSRRDRRSGLSASPTESLTEQRAIEAADTLPFESYRQLYLAPFRLHE